MVEEGNNQTSLIAQAGSGNKFVDLFNAEASAKSSESWQLCEPPNTHSRH